MSRIRFATPNYRDNKINIDAYSKLDLKSKPTENNSYYIEVKRSWFQENLKSHIHSKY